MKYQMVEYNRLINQVRMVRYDLTAKTITAEAQQLAASQAVPVLKVLRHCIRLGREDKPMPWET